MLYSVNTTREWLLMCVVGMHHIVLRPKYLGLYELDFISNPMEYN
jgi:hypothetical protein